MICLWHKLHFEIVRDIMIIIHIQHFIPSSNNMQSSFHSRRKTYFRLLLILLLLALWGFVFFKGSMFFTNQKITDQKIILDQQKQELAWYETLTGYIKLSAIRLLEAETNTMPWADRINKVIEMLNELQNLTSNQSETISLSDFKVSLDTISLRGKVSSLLLLYYSNPEKNIISLLDRFEQLDFIKDIKIKTYDKDTENNVFGFVLEAKVTDNGTTK